MPAKVWSIKPLLSEDDRPIASLQTTLYKTASACLGRAGDCEKAWEVFQEVYPKEKLDYIKKPEARAKALRTRFASTVKWCKGD